MRRTAPRQALGCALVGATMCAALPALAQDNAQKPNIVFILADNVGYGDMGPYGGGELRGMPTPVTDQLARDGMMLTQYLVEPSCTPSRAALMTGQYSIRNGLSLFIIPGTPNTLPGDAYTMGQLFKDRATPPRSTASGISASSRRACRGAHGFDTFYGTRPIRPGAMPRPFPAWC